MFIVMASMVKGTIISMLFQFFNVAEASPNVVDSIQKLMAMRFPIKLRRMQFVDIF